MTSNEYTTQEGAYEEGPGDGVGDSPAQSQSASDEQRSVPCSLPPSDVEERSSGSGKAGTETSANNNFTTDGYDDENTGDHSNMIRIDDDADHFNTYAQQLKPPNTGRHRDVLDIIVNFLVDNQYLVGRREIAAQVDGWSTNNYHNNLSPYLRPLVKVGAVAETTRAGDDSDTPDNSDTPVEIHEAVTSYFSGGFPDEIVKHIGAYIGAVVKQAGEDAIDPREAWIYGRIQPYLSKIDDEEPLGINIDIRQFGTPKKGDWKEEFPFKDILIHGKVGTNWYSHYKEFALLVDIEFENVALESESAVVNVLRTELIRYHSAALYDTYPDMMEDISADNHELITETNQRTVNQDKGFDTDFPSFDWDVDVRDDGTHIRTASLYQQKID